MSAEREDIERPEMGTFAGEMFSAAIRHDVQAFRKALDEWSAIVAERAYEQAKQELDELG